MNTFLFPEPISPGVNKNFDSPRAAGPDEKKKTAELKKASADFESIFIYQLLQTMRKTVPEGGYLSSKKSSGTYMMMFDQQVAEDLAKGEGIGLKNILFEQLSKINRVNDGD
jgi:flagellar protein FlgJ